MSKRPRPEPPPDEPPADVVALERTLPKNLEAERSVLGAILLHNDVFERARAIVAPADFFRHAHNLIFASCDRIMQRKAAAIDFVTIKDDLTNRGELEEVGGPAYISALIDGVPRSTNIDHYARIVKEKSQLRAIIFACNKTLTAAYDGAEESATLLNAADRALVEIQHGNRAGRMKSVRETSPALLDALEWRVAHRGELTGIDTGFASINAETGGWQRGDLIVVAARPSIGKTTFVLNSLLGASQTLQADGRRTRSAVFSLEMRRQPLEFRMLSSLTQIEQSTLLGGWIHSTEQWGQVSQAIGLLGEMDFHVDDTAARTVWDIRNECRRLRSEGGLDLVIVDYVQLMAGSLDKKGATRNEEVTDISRKLKIMADDLNVAVVLCSQLSRASESRSDPRPKLTDLRESGALEQDADLVLFLHRKNHRAGGCTEAILEKQRNGPTGTVNLTFNRETSTFVDGGEPEPVTPEQQKAEDQDAKTRSIIKHRARKRG